MTAARPRRRGHDCLHCGAVFPTVTAHMAHVHEAHADRIGAGASRTMTWSCWSCATVNPPTATTCTHCGWAHPYATAKEVTPMTATRTTRNCPACSARYSCVWVIDAWVCRRSRCGAEWYPDHGPEWAPPDEVGDRGHAVTARAPFVPHAYALERQVFTGRTAHWFLRPDGMTVADQRDIAAIAANTIGVAIPTVIRRRGRRPTADSWARPSTSTIAMGALAGPALVCHEVAHLLPRTKGEPWHGATWAAAYVAAVSVLCGPFHAARLRRAFDTHTTTRSTPGPPPTPSTTPNGSAPAGQCGSAPAPAPAASPTACPRPTPARSPASSTPTR